MSQSSADLIKAWTAERADLELAIVDLRTGPAGHLLTLDQREDAISVYANSLADIESLITDFSRCEPFPITIEHSGLRADPIIRLRSASVTLETAGA